MTTPPNPPRNGVDVPMLCATAASVRRDPAAGRYGFRVTNRWVSGAHSRTTVHGFEAGGRAAQHVAVTTLDTDHPEALVGTDRGPTPLEYVCAALAASMTSGAATVAAARGVDLFQVRSHVAAELDVGPMLGVPADGRGLSTAVRIDLEIEGDADGDHLRAIVHEARRRSPIAALLAPSVPLDISIRVL